MLDRWLVSAKNMRKNLKIHFSEPASTLSKHHFMAIQALVFRSNGPLEVNGGLFMNAALLHLLFAGSIIAIHSSIRTILASVVSALVGNEFVEIFPVGRPSRLNM